MNERTRTLTREWIESCRVEAMLVIEGVNDGSDYVSIQAPKLMALCDLALSAPSQAVTEGYVRWVGGCGEGV